MTSGEATGTTHEAQPEDDLYVPPVNMNYREVGAPLPEGFVPSHPGNDPTLLRIKQGLQSQGIHTPAEDIPEGLAIPALTPSHGTPVPETPQDQLDKAREDAISAGEPDDSEPVSQSPLSVSGTGPGGESGVTGEGAGVPDQETTEEQRAATDENPEEPVDQSGQDPGQPSTGPTWPSQPS